MSVSARAPGKIILLGEHAVVYGEPAIGFALSRAVTVSIAPGSGRVRVDKRARSKNAATPKELVAAALGPLAAKHDVDIALDVPPMSGLGSSAALAVALLRARAELEGRSWAERELIERAMEVENVAHGRSSGLDPAISVAGGLIAYDKATLGIERLRAGGQLCFVVGARGTHGGTRNSVGGIAQLRERAPDLVRGVIAALGECAREGRRAIERGDPELLGRAMDLAHGILSGFGIVADPIEDRVRLARAKGALGAKMSGAGGRGGAFIALAPDEKRARAICRAVDGWIEKI